MKKKLSKVGTRDNLLLLVFFKLSQKSRKKLATDMLLKTICVHVLSHISHKWIDCFTKVLGQFHYYRYIVRNVERWDLAGFMAGEKFNLETILWQVWICWGSVFSIYPWGSHFAKWPWYTCTCTSPSFVPQCISDDWHVLTFHVRFI